MNYLEKFKLGREEAHSLQLWKGDSWTPLLFYVHVKHFSIGAGIGFAMGILFATLVYLMGG